MNSDFYCDSMLSKYIHIKLLKHEWMETLNSVRASHLSFTRSTINRLSQDCVCLTDTFVEQLMCELLVLVASNAIVM